MENLQVSMTQLPIVIQVQQFVNYSEGTFI